MHNETYTIEVMSPLLRPGITIRTEVSKNFLSETVHELMEMVRRINNEERPIVLGNYARTIDYTGAMRPESLTSNSININGRSERCSTETGCGVNR